MVAIGIFCNNPSNFDEKQCISVETLLATSKFDEYSDFKPRCSSCRRMALSYTCFKQERNIKDTTETSAVTTETTTKTPSITTETPADTTETILKIICNNPKVTTKEIASTCGITEDGGRLSYYKRKNELGISCLNHRGHIIAIFSGIIANSSLIIAENRFESVKKGLAENSIQKLLLQLAHNAGEMGFWRKDAFESLQHVFPANNTRDEKLRKIGRLLVNMAKDELIVKSSNGKKWKITEKGEKELY